MITFDTLLSNIRGMGPRFLQKFNRLGLKTVGELLYHFPARYEDYSAYEKIADLAPGEECTVQAVVKKISARQAWTRRKMTVIEARLEDETGEIKATWFNQTYIQNILSVGTIANFSGKVSVSKDGGLYLSNPTYENVTQRTRETKHTGRIVPIYPETKGLTSKGIRYIIKPLLDLVLLPKEIIPEKILREKNLMHISSAIKLAHFPSTIEEGVRAKERFIFEELFLLQLSFLFERKKLEKVNAPALGIEVPMIRAFVESLSFQLTQSQKKALWEIVKDLNNSHPMNRILQGDVGSGKTIIAALAAIFCAHKGFQTAFMAPTEILARQHYETIKKTFQNHEEGVALLTSSESKIFFGHGLETILKKDSLKEEVAENKIKIVIGTHALLQKNVSFSKLALVIVDEQHRFGVSQRAALIRGSAQIKTRINADNIRMNQRENPQKSAFLPHFLSMSATPIPRTLSLTIWGDLDMSLITELPKNRKHIITKVVAPENRKKAYAFIRGEVKKDRQAFVICPRIESSDTRNNADSNADKRGYISENQRNNQRKSALLWETKAVKEEYEKLSKKIFPDLQVDMLHGKLKSKEKEKIMKNFSERKIDILVTTSVVEVGIDVPNATIMMIESAERFGLAQLYQFRGRVGRGEHQSYCFLFSDSYSLNTKKRLLSIVDARNGFELAEKDLKLRGPGEFLGEIQTGMPDIAMKALKNPEMLKETHEIAIRLLSEDLELKKHTELKNRLESFSKEIHPE